MKSKELPEGGQIKKISELIIDHLSGFACAIDTMVERDGYVQLRPFNFGDNGRLKLDTLYQIPIDQVDTNLYSLRKGDILFNNTNSIELVGKSLLVDKEYPYAFSNHINRLRVDMNSVIPAYFQYQLRHMWIKEHFALNCKKWIGQAGYTFNKLAEQMIFLPSLENQQKIVEKLDNQMAQIEMMKKEAENQLKAAKDLQVRLHKNIFDNEDTKKWHGEKLSQICTLWRGSSPRPKGDPRYYGGKIPRLLIADLTRDGKYVTPKIDFLTEAGANLSRPMKKGTVVMAVSGAAGLPAILNVDACIHDGFVGMSDLIDEVLPEYLYELLLYQQYSNYANAAGAIWRNLTTTQIKNFDLPIPPMEIQKAVVAKIEKINVFSNIIIKNSEQILEVTNQLPNSIFNEVFGQYQINS